MYSKFVSTMGESNYNRELYRPDWMHIIRSQAFANLWMKALKAHDEGLAVVRAMGTDELHVIGDWRRVFPEGRGVTEVKVKDIIHRRNRHRQPARGRSSRCRRRTSTSESSARAGSRAAKLVARQLDQPRRPHRHPGHRQTRPDGTPALSDEVRTRPAGRQGCRADRERPHAEGMAGGHTPPVEGQPGTIDAAYRAVRRRNVARHLTAAPQPRRPRHPGGDPPPRPVRRGPPAAARGATPDDERAPLGQDRRLLGGR